MTDREEACQANRQKAKNECVGVEHHGVQPPL
jgi:hypothetical protein